MAFSGSPAESTASPSDPVSVEYQHGVAFITCNRSLETADFVNLQRLVETLIARNWCLIVVDLKTLRFIDSTAAKVLTDLAERAERAGGGLRVLNPQHTVTLFLRNNGFLDKLPCAEDRHIALRELTASRLQNEDSNQAQNHGAASQETQLRNLLEKNAFVLATLAETLHSRGVLRDEDIATLFGPSVNPHGGSAE